MNRFFCIFVTLSILYLINQPEFVLSSSGGGYGSGGGGVPSKLNLGVWIPPMTLRLPKFNMPKIKISATIKPRKNQPPMKIHLPEMSLNAKALDDDHWSSGGGGSSYSSNSGGDSGGSSYSSDGNSYSSGGNSYSSGGSSYSSGGSSYPSYGGDSGYSSGGSGYSEYGGSSGNGYRASASNQNNQPNYQQPQSNSNDYQGSQQNYNQNSYNNNDYESGGAKKYQHQIQDQRNAYYVDNAPSQQQSPARIYESVTYGASNRQPIESRPNYRSSTASNSGPIVSPLSNYITKKEKVQGTAYGYGVNSARYARN